ncbi:hypothetical protein BDV27DRAFT_139238 [Aspergillus caelatus]|uniref:Uncharacterized protein n=2 Tax=Aspergillus subgen. Circumdati TaxID=2720871 RepID=A0A5N6ZIN0_9EURO|nr:uncharacterized protein BDV27DRAFT_139238 [Aspergillus caelatus]KAE8357487.1 hypothetical protein BDV27DRAFT_139238 [Aspergillus caelatus]KAE8411506.1 hypothetical protein BDV36DRAFT_274395 [Aspergillus pseudocaelatus]
MKSVLVFLFPTSFSFIPHSWPLSSSLSPLETLRLQFRPWRPFTNWNPILPRQYLGNGINSSAAAQPTASGSWPNVLRATPYRFSPSLVAH